MAEKQGNGYKQYIYGVFYSEFYHLPNRMLYELYMLWGAVQPLIF